MAIGDLLKSEKERLREAEGKRRKAFREAKKAVDAVKDQVKMLKGERDRAWAEARNHLKDGQLSAGKLSLLKVQTCEIMISRLEMKHLVCEQLLTKLEMSKTEQELARALEVIHPVVKIEPVTVADVMGAVEDKLLGGQVDTEEVWEKVHKI